jgi:adenylate kinase
MIVALTGTPGTGKTTVSEHLEDFKVVDLTQFVKEHGIGEENSEFEVDIDAMVERLDEEINEDENIVIEGHLAHHFPADYCVVLRCEPEELEARLSERDYSEGKVRENVQSEILDVILSETIGLQEKIIEIDTTGRKAEDVAEEIERRVEENETDYGSIDWSNRL